MHSNDSPITAATFKLICAAVLALGGVHAALAHTDSHAGAASDTTVHTDAGGAADNMNNGPKGRLSDDSVSNDDDSGDAALDQPAGIESGKATEDKLSGDDNDSANPQQPADAPMANDDSGDSGDTAMDQPAGVESGKATQDKLSGE